MSVFFSDLSKRRDARTLNVLNFGGHKVNLMAFVKKNVNNKKRVFQSTIGVLQLASRDQIISKKNYITDYT